MKNIDRLNICSRAVIRIGGGPLTSFEDNNVYAGICKALFDHIYKAELSVHPWKFALKQSKLAEVLQIEAIKTNPTGLKYIYYHPQDVLRVERVFKKDGVTVLDYKILGRFILSNYADLWLEYVHTADFNELPVYFINYLELKLASQLAICVGNQIEKASLLLNLASAEFFNAIYFDSQSQLETNIDLSLIGDARFSP